MDALVGRFKAVDLFDASLKAVKEARALKIENGAICRVEMATMQEYAWKDRYNGIFSRWSIGYLGDQELIKFLREA